MNKHLFVIFLTAFSFSSAYGGETWHAKSMREDFPSEWHAYCARVAEANEAARVDSSASSSQASSPELERKILAILQISGQNEQQKAKALVVLFEASKSA